MLTRHLKAALLPLLAALAATLVTWFAAEAWMTTATRDRLDQSLLLTARAVEAEIDRFRSLPDVAGEDARIRRALADPAALADANRYLEVVAAHAGASELFLIDAQGRTIAASNWNREGSFVGQDYGFRPYFRQALEAGHGQFYAIGVTTGVPGFFLSTRVESGDRTGVLVVKVDLRPLQETWRAAGASMALADADGVIFLSGRPDWLYRPLGPLDAATLARIAQTRAYDGIALGESVPLLAGPPEGRNGQGRDWIGRFAGVNETGWTLVAARPSSEVTAVAAAWAMVISLAALFLAAGFKAWDQRRQIIGLRLSQSERLEAMVAARTADLAREVDARRQAETELRAAQEHLVHAEKMAALGRMSTAIVHEISQPLAAMEATLTAAEMSLPGDDVATGSRIATAKGLIRRMQRTTRHLKSFARKETGELALIDLRPVVASAIELVTPRARALGIVPLFGMPDEPVHVLAGAVRMEQVAVNLLVNALDAMQDCASAPVTVTLSTDAGRAVMTIADAGRGIAADVLPRIAEPFFSTKTGDGSGEGGLGLGLSICKAILADFGGDLTVVSSPGKGTVATVILPLASMTREAAE